MPRPFKRIITKTPTKIRLAVIVALLFLGLSWLVDHQLSKPSAGSIDTSVPAKSSVVTPSLKSFKGAYISFSYPGSFTPAANSKPSGNIVETFVLSDRNHTPTWNLNVSVSKLPSGDLSEDGSYNFRKLNPDRFTALTWTINAQPVVVMQDNSGGFNDVAFVVHDQLIASVSASSGNSADGPALSDILKSSLENLQWLQSE